MKIRGLRWFIAAMLFFAAVLNYVDKNTLALLAPTIQKDLGIDDQGYANIQNAFQVAYTVALLASGVIVDKLGPRLSLALFLGWWSLANVFTSLARSVMSLGVMRFLLGLGEAGNWTASPKTVAEWFPPKERGLAIGLYTAGTPIGMTLAPWFVIGLKDAFGWQSAFLVTGAAGVLWLLPWLFLYRNIKTHPLLTDREREWIAAAPAANTLQMTGAGEERWTWLQSLVRLEVWCLLIGRMLTDPVWFFYQNWYPKYLVSDLHLTQGDVTITWVMFLAAGLGSLIGGWVAGMFIKRGRSPTKVRLCVMLVCALMMPLSPLVSSQPPEFWGWLMGKVHALSTVAWVKDHASVVGAVTWIAAHAPACWSLTVAAVIVFAHLAWLVNISALVVDVVPQLSLGKVFGIVAAASSLGAIVMNDRVAKLAKAGEYSQWYLIGSALHLVAIAILLAGIWRRKRTA